MRKYSSATGSNGNIWFGSSLRGNLGIREKLTETFINQKTAHTEKAKEQQIVFFTVGSRLQVLSRSNIFYHLIYNKHISIQRPWLYLYRSLSISLSPVNHFFLCFFDFNSFTAFLFSWETKLVFSILLSSHLEKTHLEFEWKFWVLYWALEMADPKPEEIIHPPMDQLQGLEYCIDSNPSWGMFYYG